MKKKLTRLILILFCGAIFAGTAIGEEKASVQEVYQKVLEAANMMESLGEEGLDALTNSKEFIWKDSYVWALNCAEGVCVAHPDKKYIGLKVTKVWDKNKEESKRKLFNIELCEGANNPYGIWVEYYWERLGYDEPQRKISFMLKVPGQPYQVTAGIYDDKTSIAELMKDLK